MSLSTPLLLLLCSCLAAVEVAPPPGYGQYPHRSNRTIIEFGWDMPMASWVRDHIAAIDQRPFDGVVFSPTKPIPHLLDAANWSETSLDFATLRAIRWNRCTSNFLITFVSDQHAFDAFDQPSFDRVVEHARLMGRATVAASCVGLVLDTEAYDTPVWANTTTRFPNHSAVEVEARFRQLGKAIMEAIRSEAPEVRILLTFLTADWPGYELLNPFVNGLIAGAGDAAPGSLIEGNEGSYWNEWTGEYFGTYRSLRERAWSRLDSDANRSAFPRLIATANSIYADRIFGHDHATTDAELDRWRHNLFCALTTSDDLVWVYNENCDWWGAPPELQAVGQPISQPTIFPGAEQAMIDARRTFTDRSALGFDLNALVKITSPSAVITAPAQDTAFRQGDTVMVTAAVTGPAVTLRIYLDNIEVATLQTAPWTWTLSGLPLGRHTVIVRPEANDGTTGTSAPIDLRIDPAPGDLDGNGNVDSSDLALLRGQFGRTGTDISPATVDANSDGQVDAIDLGIVMRALTP